MYLANQTPLRESVGSGQVSLDPESGEALDRMLKNQLDAADAWLERISRLARPAPLGTNSVGTAMSEKFEGRANTDEVSFLAVISAYREVLQQTHDAVTGAIRNFRQLDEEQRHVFTQINR